MTHTKTPEDWERVGREAVELGMPPLPGMLARSNDSAERLTQHFSMFGIWWPDFRDRLTELACLAWVENVAREVYRGHLGLCVRMHAYDGDIFIAVDADRCDLADKRAPTLAEACIAAVRAMKGGA